LRRLRRRSAHLRGDRVGTGGRRRGGLCGGGHSRDTHRPGDRPARRLSATASFPFPLAGDFSATRRGKEEALADATKFQAVDWQIVRPYYFDTVRTRLIAGRTFTEADNDPRRVID